MCFAFSTWQHEYTAVMYLTPEWNENMYGETIFFEETDEDLKKSRNFKSGNEKYETLGKRIIVITDIPLLFSSLSFILVPPF